MERRIRCPGWAFCRAASLCLLATLLVGRAETDAQAAEAVAGTDLPGIEFFERKIRPLLATRCFECHSAEAAILQGGLRLDTRAGTFAGGDGGPPVVPNDPDGSPLVQAVRYDGVEMPPAGKLPPEEIALLEEWVRRGAPMPPDVGDEPAARPEIDYETGRQFWSFRPLDDPIPPAVAAGWSRSSIDPFVLAELERQGLEPSPEAELRTLIRRVHFDLIGLPPSPREVERFVADTAPDAYERLVDRLLASPHYGERWGRHWLDLARYSDAQASWLDPLAQAWLYRDWVTRALNEDLAYDTFVRRQLAADLMPDSKPADIAALGFLGLGPVYWKELKLDKEVIKGTVAEEWEERLDAVGRTFLGLTIACARCHDHKYDPISTEDYYALAGVMANTRLIDRPVIPAAEYEAVRAAREQIASLKAEIAGLETAQPLPDAARDKIEGLRVRIAEIERTTPHYRAPAAHAVDDAALSVEADGADATKLVYKPGEAIDLHVHVRGNPSRPGDLVPRRFLTVLSPGSPRPLDHGSGRVDLAEAIVTDAAPLAARVIVNRVWRHHFGRGLVDTPSDFGAQGSAPTHPELLEHLASRFVEGGWSLKRLHREIVLSATYRQRPTGPDDPAARSRAERIDPENRLLWRASRRRLDVEAWRDAALAAAGLIDDTMYGPPVDLGDAANVRRTIYGRVDRYDLDVLLRLYDFPDPLGHSPGREPTTTPLQQLFVLNSPFLRRQASALAERVSEGRPGDVAGRVRAAYEVLYGRPPSETELRLGLVFLRDETETAEAFRPYAHALLGGSEFLFVD